MYTFLRSIKTYKYNKCFGVRQNVPVFAYGCEPNLFTLGVRWPPRQSDKAAPRSKKRFTLFSTEPLLPCNRTRLPGSRSSTELGSRCLSVSDDHLFRHSRVFRFRCSTAPRRKFSLRSSFFSWKKLLCVKYIIIKSV